MTISKKDLKLVREVADLVGVSIPTVRDWAHKGFFPGAYRVPYGKKYQWLFTDESIESFWEGRKSGEPTESTPETA